MPHIKLLLIAVLLFFGTSPAYSCLYDPRFYTEYFEYSDTIFRGKITAYSLEKRHNNLQIAVMDFDTIQTFKGKHLQHRTVVWVIDRTFSPKTLQAFTKTFSADVVVGVLNVTYSDLFQDPFDEDEGTTFAEFARNLHRLSFTLAATGVRPAVANINCTRPFVAKTETFNSKVPEKYRLKLAPNYSIGTTLQKN